MSLKRTAAAAHVRHYLNTRAKMGGLDQQMIHGANDVELTRDHLEALLAPEPLNDAGLWRVYLSGIGTGIATYLVNRGAPPDVAQATGQALARIMDGDPALRTDLLETLGRLYTTGEVRPEDWGHRDAYIVGHPHD